jgi:fatty-acid desaturase
MRPGAGPDEETAQNVRWLSLMHFFQGENWHRNHHDRPGSARLGGTRGQLDVGWYTILLLERLGLATEVRRPTIERSLDAAA